MIHAAARASQRSALRELDSLRSVSMRSRLGEPSHEDAVDRLRAMADQPDALWSQWQLGAYLLRAEARPGAVVEAAHWLQRAADADLAPAMDRMADLHLRAHGQPFAPDQALLLHLALADRGYYRAAWEAAYLASRLGVAEAAGFARHQVSAASLFARACALGNPPGVLLAGIALRQRD